MLDARSGHSEAVKHEDVAALLLAILRDSLLRELVNVRQDSDRTVWSSLSTLHFHERDGDRGWEISRGNGPTGLGPNGSARVTLDEEGGASILPLHLTLGVGYSQQNLRPGQLGSNGMTETPVFSTDVALDPGN